MTLNLLLFAITFTIFLEIEFDFIFYVPYRSEEISPGENGMDLSGRSKKIAKIRCLLGFIYQMLATNSGHFLFYLV